MTINTESHLEAVTLESVHSLHRTVAFLAGKIFSYMSLMIEQYVLRKIVYFLPWSRRLVVEVPVLFLNPGMIGNDVFVTVQALFHRWQARMIGIANVWMTIKTLNLLNPNVQLVAEGYGLFRANIRGINIEEI
jgi:hypothetical protein